MDPKLAASELRKLRELTDDVTIRQDSPQHTSWKAKVDAVMQAALGNDSETLKKFRQLRYSVGIWTGAPGESQRDATFFAKQVDEAAGLIDAAIYQLELVSRSGSSAKMSGQDAFDGPVFIVHGHDDAHKFELVRLLEKTVKRKAIILHEQPNHGDTILEKLERHTQSASFAIVLLTSDDEGRSHGDTSLPLKPRGRQNVILELGMFIGQIGRSRVVVLKDLDVEEPSDLNGLVYIELDPASSWRVALLKELDAVGIAVDFKRIP